MGRIYNNQSLTERRRILRNNMSKAETLLWQEIRNKKLLGCKFRRQFSFGHWVVDFYLPEIKLAIEVDGPDHKVFEEIQKNKFRQDEIEILDISFLRFDNEEIYEALQDVISKIKIKIIELRLKADPLSVSPLLRGRSK